VSAIQRMIDEMGRRGYLGRSLIVERVGAVVLNHPSSEVAAAFKEDLVPRRHWLPAMLDLPGDIANWRRIPAAEAEGGQSERDPSDNRGAARHRVD